MAIARGIPHTNSSTANILYRIISTQYPHLRPYSYSYSLPHENTTTIGFAPKQVLICRRNQIDIIENTEITDSPLKNAVTRSVPSDSSSPFETIQSLLNKNMPYFFLVSLDFYRGISDPKIPLAILIQPQLEINLHSQSEPTIWSTNQELLDIAKAAIADLPSAPKNSCPKSAQNMTTYNWLSESDASFSGRLQQAIQTLKNPTLQGQSAKMIVTRSYEQSVKDNLEPFRLYEIYSELEPNCAASHFAELGNNIVSLGCSPENIFELKNDTVKFDVIAATRGISDDPEKNMRWQEQLLQDPKENTEHIMALERYKQRLDNLCEPGSVTIDFSKRIREFKHLRHLHSQLTGKLRSKFNFFDLLKDSYPPLNSYPEELAPLADPRKEPSRFYGGMVGRIGLNWGDTSCFLNLRAALLKQNQLFTQGGVGVIKDSQAELELLEVQNKLSCLMEAVALWQNEENVN